MAQARSNTKKRENLSIRITIGPCRMSYPHFFEPQDTDNGKKYQGDFLFPPEWKGSPNYKKFEDALYDATEDMFGPEDDWPKGSKNRWPGDVVRSSSEREGKEGYKKGWVFLKASSKDQPGIVDAKRQEVINPREVYGGRWCMVNVTVSAYDNMSKGVGVYLNSVQVLHHDEPFGNGRGEARDDFEDWQGEDLSDDERGTGAGDRGRDRRSSRDDSSDDRRGSRGSDREDTGRDRGTRSRRDSEDEDRGSRRGSSTMGQREEEDTRYAREAERGRSRRGDDDSDRPRGRDREARDDDRERGRSRRDDDRGGRDDRYDRGDRGSRRSSRNEEEWN